MSNESGKKIKEPSTQEYLEIAEIREGVVIMRDGSFRMVLLVSAINFALKSEEEQNSIVYQYQNFLNSLSFPIQIVLQSRQTDLSSYIIKLKERLNQETNELIRLQIADYIEFIQRLISIANIMDKKFFAVVPLFPPNLKKRGIFDKLLNPKNPLTVKISNTEFISFKEELMERCNIIMNGLAGMGVRSVPLNTQQLIELYYNCYNPEEATSEKLTEVGELGSNIISQKQDNSKNNSGIQSNTNTKPDTNIK